MADTTDLTLAQFEVFDQFLPRSKTRGYVISRRLIVNAILYQLKNGCQWRDLPADYPNWLTVYSQFRRWKINGVWEQALIELEKIERAARGKKRISNFTARRFDVCDKHGHG